MPAAIPIGEYTLTVELSDDNPDLPQMNKYTFVLYVQAEFENVSVSQGDYSEVYEFFDSLVESADQPIPNMRIESLPDSGLLTIKLD